MIIFCHLLNDSSGSPKVLNATIKALSEPQQENRLYVGSGGRGILENAATDVVHYWYRRRHWRILTLFTFTISQVHLFWRLARAGDIPKDAVIYVNTLLPFGGALWGKLSGRKVVYHLHEVSISPRILQKFLQFIVKRTASRLIYVSHDHMARLPIEGIAAVVVPNPIDQSLYDCALDTKFLPRRSGHFNVLMLASLRDYKGVPEFISLAKTFEGEAEFSFSLVLNASEPEIARYMTAHQIPNNLSVHPRTDDPASFYAQADLVTNLSRVEQWVETFGLTIIEALAFGLPVIAPPVGGPAEILTDQVDGFLIDSRESKALVATIKDLASDPERYQAMSIAGRKRAADFRLDHFRTRLAHEIQALNSKGRPE